jgi:hypothetical protein
MLPRDWTPVQRFARETDGAVLVWPSPFDLHRFRRGPSGLLDPASSPVLTPATPLCGLPFSSKQHLATALTCAGECTSPGVPFPFSARQPGAPVYPDGLPHHRHLPFTGFLTLSTACFALGPVRLLRRDFARRSSRLRSWGSPGFLRLASRLATRAGPTDTEFPLQGSPQPRDERVFARSPLVRFAGAVVASFRDAAGHVNDGRYRVSIAGPSALPR